MEARSAVRPRPHQRQATIRRSCKAPPRRSRAASPAPARSSSTARSRARRRSPARTTIPQLDCPYGVPVIPTKPGGLGALLNSAPKLLERLSTLTERLTELLSRQEPGVDRRHPRQHQPADRRARRSRAGDRRDAGRDAHRDPAGGRRRRSRSAIWPDHQRRCSPRMSSPAIKNLNETIAAAQHSMETLNAAIADARPGHAGLLQADHPRGRRSSSTICARCRRR